MERNLQNFLNWKSMGFRCTLHIPILPGNVLKTNAIIVSFGGMFQKVNPLKIILRNRFSCMPMK